MFLSRNWVRRLSVKAPLGVVKKKKYPPKRRYIRSCARLKDLLYLSFLGTIDLAKIYFHDGAGQIRHMLVMGWGGECTATMALTPHLSREIHRSNKEVKALGIIHEDLRRDNVLWCEELGRALIIDFHRSTLRCRPAKQRLGPAKRLRIS